VEIENGEKLGIFCASLGCFWGKKLKHWDKFGFKFSLKE